jgi:hypothetical protein
MLAVLATWKSARVHGRALVGLSEDELLELDARL